MKTFFETVIVSLLLCSALLSANYIGGHILHALIPSCF